MDRQRRQNLRMEGRTTGWRGLDLLHDISGGTAGVHMHLPITPGYDGDAGLSAYQCWTQLDRLLLLPAAGQTHTHCSLYVFLVLSWADACVTGLHWSSTMMVPSGTVLLHKLPTRHSRWEKQPSESIRYVQCISCWFNTTSSTEGKLRALTCKQSSSSTIQSATKERVQLHY
jgi:hypothetical protein